MARNQMRSSGYLAMVQIYGPGPAGATCKGCKHLKRFASGTRRRWMRCGMVWGQVHQNAAGAAGDWRAGWPACGKHEEQKP